MNIIELSGPFAYYDFPVLSEKIHKSEIEIIKRKEMILNLQDVTFIDPLGMISIVGACRHIYNKHKIITTVQLPQGSAGSYMERAGFKEIKDEFIQTTRKKNFTEFFKNNTNIGVLLFFKSEEDIKALNKEVEIWLISNKFSEEEVMGISIFISEMVQNVVQHSQSPQDGVLCIQSYQTKTGPILAWAIGDSGRGIKQSFIDTGVNKMNNYSDSEVIRRVIENGLSRHQDDPTRGNGLSSLYKAAMKRSASIYIHSRSGTFARKFSNNNTKRKLSHVPDFLGTHIGFFISQS
jgi:anti-sigma regulatory factor (Ser/Thr protein kinase)/anti-anti-sigma regulatory factor